MSTVSIAIPTYEMHDHGAAFLDFSLERISQQTFTDIDVVVSDHSANAAVKDVCDTWRRMDLDIKYLQNKDNRGSSSANINNALRAATGKYIKILFQDDFLFSNTAIEKTVQFFEAHPDRQWLVSACGHSPDGIHWSRPLYPAYHDKIHLGCNTISSPSVLTIRNEQPLLFDEQLLWLMDVEYYKRLHDAFGAPLVLNEITVINRVWEKQVSHTLTDERKQNELAYVQTKYF